MREIIQDWKIKYIIDNNIKNVKEDLIWEYKQTMQEIRDLTFEINEIEETKHFLPEEQQEVASQRIEILTNKRTEKRDRIWEITNEGIQKFGPEIIQEF